MAVMRIEGDCTKDCDKHRPVAICDDAPHERRIAQADPANPRYAGSSHEAALHRALTGLSREFDRWRRAEIDSLALADRIHEFHDGPNREIYLRYNGKTDPRVLVGHAVHEGLLKRESIAPELMPYLASALQIWEEGPLR